MTKLTAKQAITNALNQPPTSATHITQALTAAGYTITPTHTPNCGITHMLAGATTTTQQSCTNTA